MTDKIILQVQLEEKDFLRFYSKQYNRTYAIYLIGGLYFLGTSIYLFISGNFNTDNTWDLARLFIGIAFISLPIMLKFKLKRGLIDSPLKQFTQTYNFSDTGILIESTGENGNSSHTLAWIKFYKIIETTEYIYLHVSRQCSFILPKRCFENKEQLKTLRDLFQKNIETKKLELLPE